MTTTEYRGRFAPSPTGPLHFGSLVTALASFLEARTRKGKWLVRIEDLDPLRESPEATDRILKSLEAHSLHWDEGVRYQSARLEIYHTVADDLVSSGFAYRCGCSRSELRANDGHHPFHCREGGEAPPDRPVATRFALTDEVFSWRDRILGPQQQVVQGMRNDPVILRKEGFVAYQLAVVVDDVDQSISDIVRGSDLLETTAQQQQIYRALGATPPSRAHIPVVLNRQGQKLSKQNHAPALDDTHPGRNLWDALVTLGQQPPTELRDAPADLLLSWADEAWDLTLLPRSNSHAPEYAT
ncbi:glutamyl-Q tRNA(Asp) synthetase [Marinobacter daqiaonensis]|uniref:Glutamyl-Q tRNA(Asp) synthetase n=1 Tax=Marinobacter daqiaonensis TaxID=650891 RepID=A0A1I6JW96_9GAMM|nr:tRNA glutamyl-Q(34) synthetase GluQRS [Marinobacter daqiaonensis]SFR83265.1 glutamyl-Q tRNA(Asp) synthetase [Marinobacter daqiaonensis]